MKFGNFNFYWILSLISWAITKNFNKKLKISIKTQTFAQCSSLEIIINTSLKHSMQFGNFTFFLILSLISSAKPIKPKNFDKKFKISINTQTFAQYSSLEIVINSSLNHTVKFGNSNFFWILSLISWAITFETQEFRQKIENFHQHPNFCIVFILRNYNQYLP